MNLKQRVLSLGAVALLGLGTFGVMGVTAVQGQTGGQSNTQAGTQSDPEGLLAYEQNTISVVERVGPSVVSVNVTAQGERMSPTSPFGDLPEDQIPPQLRDFFRQFQDQFQDEEQTPQPRQGSGSGFVIDDQGRMITNYHVVRAALQEGSAELTEGSSVTVTFPSNDEEYPVRVVGANALYDLALLEFEDAANLPEDASPIPIANSDEVAVGQKAIAIGNPFQLEFTVTTGVVSAISRNAPSVGRVNVPYVQTDAAINPGNSGGPLLNSDGELIGINTQILSGGNGFVGTPGNIGIGFAVPSNLLQQNLAQLEEGGFVDLQSRARLGIQIQDVEELATILPERVRNNLDLPENGVLVQRVEPGSAAEQAGLQGSQEAGFEVMVNGQPIPVGGDIIIAVNGTPVDDTAELQNQVLSQQDGDTVTLTILRDGEEQEIGVTLSVVPQQEQQAEAQGDQQGTGGQQGGEQQGASGPRLGVAIVGLQNLPEAVRSNLDYPEQGVLVTEVQPGSAAAEAGLQGGAFSVEANGQPVSVGGDVILAVNGQEVTTPQEVQQAVSSQSAGDTLELRILRDGEEQTVQATLSAPEGQNN